MERLFEVYVCKLEGNLHDKDQAGFYSHLKKMEIGGKESASAEYAKSEDGRLLGLTKA